MYMEIAHRLRLLELHKKTPSRKRTSKEGNVDNVKMDDDRRLAHISSSLDSIYYEYINRYLHTCYPT
jgi:hypothetical protein